jgi:hypothetical protein
MSGLVCFLCNKHFYKSWSIELPAVSPALWNNSEASGRPRLARDSKWVNSWLSASLERLPLRYYPAGLLPWAVRSISIA